MHYPKACITQYHQEHQGVYDLLSDSQRVPFPTHDREVSPDLAGLEGARHRFFYVQHYFGDYFALHEGQRYIQVPSRRKRL